MKRVPIIIAVIFLFLILTDAFYVVTETTQVIITQFGEPLGETITEPGLKLKLPLFHKVNRFEKRWLEWDGEANQIPTKDKKFIWVDTYARWRISDPLVFFQRVRDEWGAQSRLDDVIDGETRNIIAIYDLIEIVRSSNRDFELTEELLELDASRVIVDIEKGRDKIAGIILENSREKTMAFGVDLRDVRIKRVNYVDEVQRKVFDRMISERKRIAEKYRSEGDGRAAEIRGQKERELARIQSEAYRRAQEIRGVADARAIRIYADAFNQDPDFYSFMRTLETYEQTMDSTTTLVLTTDSEYLRFLKGIN